MGLFKRSDDRLNELEGALKARRSEPSQLFVRNLAARLQERREERRWLRPSGRAVLVGLLVASALTVSASAGAFGTARSSAHSALHVVRALTATSHSASPTIKTDKKKKDDENDGDDDDNPGHDQYKHDCGHAPHARCHARLTPDHIITREGDSGMKTVTFTVKLNKKSDGSVTINYTTLDGTATAADHDYQPTSGTLTFAAGEKTKTITVTIYGDTKVEHNEDFFVKITSGGSNVKIDGDGKNRVEISNDDRNLSRQV